MSSEYIRVFNIVAAWYFVLSSNVITSFDQTWLISVNLSRVLRKCFLFLILILMAKILYFYLRPISTSFLLTMYFFSVQHLFFSARVVSTLGKLNWTIQRPTVWSPYHTTPMNFVTAEAISLERERRKKVKHTPSCHLSEIDLFPMKIGFSRNI